MSNDTLIKSTEAAVTTVTVGIQVVRIGAKQMTLAVFRQLQSKTIFGKKGELIAPAWGWVNYDRQYPSQPFIFSYEGVLYRTNIILDEIDRKPTAHAETEWAPPESFREEGKHVETGRWCIGYEEYGDYGYLQRLRFESKEQTEAYIRGWKKSIGALMDVQQLYIGV